MKKPKQKQIRPKDLIDMNTLNVGVRYPRDNQDRAQLRGGKPRFAARPLPTREGRR